MASARLLSVLSIFMLLLVFTGSSSAQVTLPLPATEQVKILAAAAGSGESDLVIRPDNPQIMYWAVESVGVLKSVDGGTTWTPKNYGLPTVSVIRLAMDPLNPDHLMVGFQAASASQGPPPYRTLDGGERWEPTLVCDNQENVRQIAFNTRMLFDPTSPNRFYYLVDTEDRWPCGGFYRSCDQGATYDRNPNCFGPGQYPRPACAASDPEPVNSIPTNDAAFLEVHPDGTLFGGTRAHPDESALMTSRDKGGYWTWEDVIDTTGTFIASADQSINGLFLDNFKLAPSNPDLRYAVVPPTFRCNDGKAYGSLYSCPGGLTSLLNQVPLIVRWSGELSGNVDCQGNNDCDGDAARDRVWRPIHDPYAIPGAEIFGRGSLLVHPTNPNRIFFLANYGTPVTLVTLAPADPGHPEITPWPATTLGSGYAPYSRLIADPVNPDRFYILENTRVTTARIIRIASTDGWNTAQQTVLATSSDYLHVYDLLETSGSDGHRVIVASTRALEVFNEFGTVVALGGNPSVASHAVAFSPSDPDRVFAKRSWALEIGTGGFDSLVDMDNSLQRLNVMCTNVFNDIAVDPEDSARVYAATEGGIWIHPDAHVPLDQADLEQNGLLWTSLARAPQGLVDEYVWRLAFDPSDLTHDTLLAGTRSGAIFQSVDRGQSWSPTETQAPQEFLSVLRDVRDFKFRGTETYAATGAGVLRRLTPQSAWTPVLSGDKIWRVAVGATGQRRVYAAGGSQLYRSRDGGGTWETLPLTPRAPYSAVLETTSRGGRHHLWVPDYRAGLYRISSTMKVRSGTSEQQVILDWTEGPGSPYTSYRLYYGQDPDLLDGTGAVEGASPIALGGVSSATLTGLDFRNGTWYVALRGLDASGAPGPMGLPLRIDFDYAFSPQPSFIDLGTCPYSGRLDWSPVADATGYRIYRGTSISGPFSLRASPSAEDLSYIDVNGSSGGTFYYYMTAIRQGQETGGGEIVRGVMAGDFDRDFRLNCLDNCPQVANSNQLNTDGDSLGNACDPDDDNDGDPDVTDCAPLNAAVHHGAAEACNLVDDNCNALIDDGFDLDEDGYTSCGGDCNDWEWTVHPGATELCNWADDDCDGFTDEGFDNDQDGYISCHDDCNDADPGIHPGATETCNGTDDNCNGTSDEAPDPDGDGHACADDCDEADPLIFGAENVTRYASCFDNLDNDCDGVTDWDCALDVLTPSNERVVYGNVSPAQPAGLANMSSSSPDGSYESITEQNPAKRVTVYWTFNLPTGFYLNSTWYDLRVEGLRVPGNNDNFIFSWAQRAATGPCTELTDNVEETYSGSLTVSDTSESLQFTLVGPPNPATVSFCVKVVDSNQGTDTKADTLKLDKLYLMPVFLDAKADNEGTDEGTRIQGSYLSTQSAGGGQEGLREGPPTNHLVHTYVFPSVPIGSAHRLYFEGWRSGTDFEFSYALPLQDGTPGTFQNIAGAVVSALNPPGAVLSGTFGQPGMHGKVFIRIRDRVGGTNLDSVYIDYLAIKTTQP